MIKLLGATDFLSHVAQHRILNLGGDVGTGKSSLAVALSYLWLRGRLADKVVSTMPIAFAVPAARITPPANFVAVLDELGTELDSRSFGNKRQNSVRVNILAFLRKLNITVIVASRISPDASFRSLTVQRIWNLNPLLPLEVYNYGIEDGKTEAFGTFMVWDRGWLWNKRVHPTPLYGHEAVPGGFTPIFDLFARAVAEARNVSEEPNDWPESDNSKFSRWLGMAFRSADDSLSEPAQRGDGEVAPGEGDSGSWGRSYGEVLAGAVTDTARSGGSRFNM